MNTTIPIKTKSLLLKKFSLTDAQKIFIMSQEKGMRNWLPDQVYEDENKAKEILQYLTKHYHSSPVKDPFVLGCYLKSSGELIGHVGLSPKGKQVEIGYAIEEKHQGKGFATEIVTAMSDWSIKTFNLPCILGIVATDNKSSCRVLEKSGFKLATEVMESMHGKKRMVRTYRKEQNHKL